MRGKRWLTAAIIFVGFAALYLATPTSNYTFDAVSYASNVRDALRIGPEPLFHPHHLLFNGAGYLVWRAAAVFSPTIDPLRTLQIMNAVWGALGLVILFLVLNAVLAETRSQVPPGRRIIAALLFTVLTGVSFGWWVASTDGRVNIPPMPAIIGALYFAWLTARTGSVWTATAAGALTATAALLHQSHGMFVVVVAVAAAMAPVVVRRKLILFASTLAAFVVTMGVPYLLVLQLKGIHSAVEAERWMLTYAHQGIWWDFNVATNIGKDASAFTHAWLTDTPAVSFTHKMAMLVIVTASLAVTLVWRGLRSKKGTHDDALRKFNVLVAAWILLYGAFFTIWAPGYFAFWIPVAAAVVMLAAVNAVTRRSVIIIIPAAGLAIILLAGINLRDYILPHMPESSNKYVSIAQEIDMHTQPDSCVLICGMGYLAPLETYIPYFSCRQVLSLNQTMLRYDGRGLDRLSREIREQMADGHRVYVLREVFDSPEAWRQLQDRYALHRNDVARALQPFQRKPAFTVENQKVYELQPRLLKGVIDLPDQMRRRLP